MSIEEKKNIGSYYDTKTLWEDIVVICAEHQSKTGGGQQRSDTSVNSTNSTKGSSVVSIQWKDLLKELLEVPIITESLSEDELESLFLLSSPSLEVSNLSTSTMTFVSFLYYLELLSDRLNTDKLLVQEEPELYRSLPQSESPGTRRSLPYYDSTQSSPRIITTEMKLLLLFKSIIAHKTVQTFEFLFIDKPRVETVNGEGEEMMNEDLLNYYEIYYEIMNLLKQSKIQLLLFSQPSATVLTKRVNQQQQQEPPDSLSSSSSPHKESPQKYKLRIDQDNYYPDDMNISLEDNWEIFHQMIECFLQIFFSQMEGKESTNESTPQPTLLHPANIIHSFLQATQEFLIVEPLPLWLQRTIYAFYHPLDELHPFEGEVDHLATSPNRYAEETEEEEMNRLKAHRHHLANEEYLQQHYEKYISYFQLIYWIPSLLFPARPLRGSGSSRATDVGVFRVMYNPMVFQLFQQIQQPSVRRSQQEEEDEEEENSERGGAVVSTVYTMFLQNIYQRFFSSSSSSARKNRMVGKEGKVKGRVYRYTKYFNHIQTITIPQTPATTSSTISSPSSPFHPPSSTSLSISSLNGPAPFPSAAFHALSLGEVQKLLFDSHIVASKTHFPLLHSVYRHIFATNDVISLLSEAADDVLVPFHQLLEMMFLFAFEVVRAERKIMRASSDSEGGIGSEQEEDDVVDQNSYLLCQETFELFVSFLHKVNIREFERREYDDKKKVNNQKKIHNTLNKTSNDENKDNDDESQGEKKKIDNEVEKEEGREVEDDTGREKEKILLQFEDFLIKTLFPNHPNDEAVYIILRLLLFYPLTSVKLNVWTLSYLFQTVEQHVREQILALTSSHEDGIGSREVIGVAMTSVTEEERVEMTLMEVLKEFCTLYQIPLYKVMEFLTLSYPRYLSASHRHQNNGRSSSGGAGDWNGLLSSLMMSSNIIRILSLNEDLLKYEYARCFSLYSSSTATSITYFADGMSSPTLDSPSTSFSTLSLEFDYLPFLSQRIFAPPRITSSVEGENNEVVLEGGSKSKVEELFCLLEYERCETVLWLSREAVAQWYYDTVSSNQRDSDQDSSTLLPSIEEILVILDDIINISGGDSTGNEDMIGLNFSRFLLFLLSVSTKSIVSRATGYVNRIAVRSADLREAHHFHNAPHEAVEEDPQVMEELLVQQIRKLLHCFAQNLSSLQKSLHLHILTPLFNASTTLDDVTDVEKKTRVTMTSHLLKHFNHRINYVVQNTQPLPSPSQRVSLEDRLISLPPRPPSMLYDAPRLVEYARYYGLLSVWKLSSLAIVWKVFGMILFRQHTSLYENWTSNEVPPLPLKITTADMLYDLHHQMIINLRSLKEIESEMMKEKKKKNKAQIKDEEKKEEKLVTSSSVDILSSLFPLSSPTILSSSFLYHQIFLPDIIAITERNKLRQQQTFSTKGSGGGSELVAGRKKFAGKGLKDIILLEDLLRFGGGVTLHYYSDQTFPFLSIVFLALQRKAHPQRQQQQPAQSHNTQRKLEGVEEFVQIGLEEVPMNVICQFFSCYNILSVSDIIMLVKESLHHRIRPPPPHNPQPNSKRRIAMTSLNFSEFEELFFRCAYEIWKKFYFLYFTKTVHSLTNTSSSSSHTTSNTNHNSYAHPPNPHPKYRLAVELLKKEMEKVIKPKIDSYLAQYHPHLVGSNPPPSSSSSWGMNFIKAYSIVLQTYSEFPVKDFHFYRDVGGFDRISLNQLAIQWFIQQKQVLIRKSQENFQEKQKNSFQSPGKVAIKHDEENKGMKVYTTPEKEKEKTAAKVHVNKKNITINTELAEKEHDQRKSKQTLPTSPLLDVIKSDFTHSVASPVYRKNFSRSRSNDSSVVTGGTGALSGFSLFQNSSHPPLMDSPDSIIHQAKEALWPVFATYCSCGDHVSSPGKLSGANLFTLLSKLGILQEPILLTDVAIILYQIASRNHQLNTSLTTIKVLSKQVTSGYLGLWETPSLTFEEFLIFLHEFSKLIYDDIEEEFSSDYLPTPRGDELPLTTPPRSTRSNANTYATPPLSAVSAVSTSEVWMNRCLKRLRHSQPFQRLLIESIFPIIEKKALLAFPEDARLRDRFSVIFSFPVLLAVEAVEGNLQEFFQKSMKLPFVNANSLFQQQQQQSNKSSKSRANEEISFIMKALKQIHLIPNVMNEAQVLQLVKDVLPEINTALYYNQQLPSNSSSPSPSPSPMTMSQSSPVTGGANNGGRVTDGFLFSQWEYLLCVVACQAVDSAVRQSSTLTDEKVRDSFFVSS